MISIDPVNLINGIRLSTVSTGTVTGENAVHELSNMDLAMKLHYIKTVCFYRKEAFEGFDIFALKDPMFVWLNVYCSIPGRVRRSDSGRPFIKCNDSGVRIIEANCNLTIDEWLDMKDYSLNKHLFSNRILGPELIFSPTVLVQLTKFKCGGMAVGLSWAHVLGDPQTAFKSFNMWPQALAGAAPTQTVDLPRTAVEKPGKGALDNGKPASVKQIEPVGDLWIPVNNYKMEPYSFHINGTHLNHLKSKISDHIAPFEAISALIWQLIAKFREEREPKIVTVCRKSHRPKEIGLLINDQIISAVEADFRVADGELSDLATLITNCKNNESMKIEALIDNDTGLPDLIVYGANLTFVDLDEIDLYGFEFKGKKPVSAYFTMDGVGDEGVVLVLPGPPNCKEGNSGADGKMVTVVLPENEVRQLRDELQKNWSIT